MTNALYFGDNLDVLRRHVPDESVDLVYLDPPFNSDATYNVLFKTVHGDRSEAQAEAFRDTWDWGQSAEEAFDDLRLSGGPVFLLVDGLRKVLRESRLMAYVSMMAVRLVDLRKALKPTGSLYLHCDPTAAHYLKILLDQIFGPAAFRSEITWKRSTSHGNTSRNYGSLKDTILFYTCSDKYEWNQQYAAYDEEYVREKFRGRDSDGRRWQSVTLRNPSPRPNLIYEFAASNGSSYRPHPNGWSCDLERMSLYDREGRLHFPEKEGGQLRLKMYLDESPGTKLQNIWTDIPALNSQAKERLGYPTQKPVALLERIIKTSCGPDGVVLDPFCGCGTTIEAAQRLGRSWIGIDVAHHAVTLIESRLRRAFPELKPSIYGRPNTLDGAADLARRDKHQFQWWASWLVGCQVFRDAKRGADRGIDADVFFQNGPYGTGRAIVSVKGGDNVGVGMVRDLRGVVEREGATMGILVTLADPTGPMLKEATSAGFVEKSAHGRLLKIRVVTIRELLEGLKPVPSVIQPSFVETAAKKKARRADPRQAELLLPMPSIRLQKADVVAPGFEQWRDAAS